MGFEPKDAGSTPAGSAVFAVFVPVHPHSGVRGAPSLQDAMTPSFRRGLQSRSPTRLSDGCAGLVKAFDEGMRGGAARGIHYPGERWGLRKRGFLMTRRDRGGGSRLRLPPPRQPHPRGGDSPSIHCHGGDFFSRFQARNSSKILPPRRGTVSGSIATHCPPPLEGAGGGRGSGREVGVYECRSTRDAGDR